MFEVPWESFEYKLRNSDHLMDGYKDERFIEIKKKNKNKQKVVSIRHHL